MELPQTQPQESCGSPKVIRLLGNMLHVRGVPPPKESRGGILLPGQYQDDAKQWLVLGVGPGRRRPDGSLEPMEVQPGDYVLLPMYDGYVEVGDGTRLVRADRVEARWRDE